MVFSSPVFLFAFLPISLLIYYSLPTVLKNLFLLIASILFYAWGEVNYYYLMLISILFNFFAAKAIKLSNEKISKLFLIGAIIINLLPLFYFKYLNFFKSIAGIAPDGSIGLPLGISFFTFHSLSYIIDVFRYKSSPQKNLVQLGLYITNFPQLVAGPIVRYPEIEEQLNNHSTSASLFISGINRFIIGLAKKILIANTVAIIADKVFNSPINEINFTTAWIGLVCYTIQIYFDFSGYSDMAIGLGYMFGFKFPENFNFPYNADSIKDFWRRWHISLSNWLRDYVYIPLGGSRISKFRTYLNLVIIFLLCGLWHGASWCFIAWGIWHGFFLVLERMFLEKILIKFSHGFRVLYTIFVVMIGWILFRSETLEFAYHFFTILIGIKNFSVSNILYYFPDTEFIIAIICGFLFSFPFVDSIEQRLNSYTLIRPKLLSYVKVSFIFLIFSLTVLYLSSGTYNPFIYFRF